MARRITEEQLVAVLADEVEAFGRELERAIEDGDVDAVTLKIEEAKTWQTQAASLSLTNSRPVQSLSRKMATIAAKAARWLNTQEAPEPETEKTAEAQDPPATPPTNSTALSESQSEQNPPKPSDETSETSETSEAPPAPANPATVDHDPKQEKSAPKPAPATATLRRL
jgi:hypothetical protein